MRIANFCISRSRHVFNGTSASDSPDYPRVWTKAHRCLCRSRHRGFMKLLLTWIIEAWIMAGMGIGFKFPLASGSVAAELGAFSASLSLGQNQKNPSPVRGEGHRYLFPCPPAQVVEGQETPGYSGFRFVLLSAPSRNNGSSGLLRISSTVTAAGQRRFFTVFPEAFPVFRHYFFQLL
jgi:hypothetical protein